MYAVGGGGREEKGKRQPHSQLALSQDCTGSF